MNVFICTESPFGKIGGGESFYRHLVSSSPGIHFFFFGDAKRAKNLPRNVSLILRKTAPRVKGIEYQNTFNRSRLAINEKLNDVEKSALRNALMIAKAIQQIDIDHIHVPEYEIVGRFLKDALQFYDLGPIPTSTFIHGGLSQTMKFRENIGLELRQQLAKAENEQREDADENFAFMFSNIKHIEENTEIVFLDPILMLSGRNQELRTWIEPKNHAKPLLILAGRHEPVKGFEQILNLYPYLTSHFSGIEFWNNSNKEEDLKSLSDLAKIRDIKLKFHRPDLNRPFFDKFPENGLLVIPSMFDNFNLMALEAATLGLPIVISKEAGASAFLKDLDPLIDKFIFDPNDSVSILTVIKAACEDYFELRKLMNELSIRLSRSNSSNLEMIDFGKVAPKGNKDNFEAKVLLSVNQFRYYFVRYSPNSIINLFKKLKVNTQSLIRRSIKLRKINVTYSTRLVLHDYLKWLKSNNYLVSHFPYIKKIVGLPIIFGRNHTFALYSDRAVLNEDFQSALVFQLRLIRESNVLNGPDLDISIDLARKTIDPRILNLLKSSLYKDSHPEGPILKENLFDIIEERAPRVRVCLENRLAKQPILEIVVSSYAARNKLPLFLTKLSLQDLVQRGEVGLIFVDANSPELDYKSAFDIASGLNVGIKSFQMKDRISIQEAWNFGIKQSSAPYLVFLGTDEAIFPSSLEGAISELEQNETLDWITYSSFASEVDSKGSFRSDKGTFDRKGFKPSLQYLDSSYINFVGGVLRKSIFERFGYFDGTFKGAGDTEFKSRIMKQINVKCSPIIGGQFLDYPEERTTASMMAEIEDFIAWYNYRRGYELRNLSNSHPDVIKEMYKLALGYRKSYAGHKSTDIFMASRILEFNPGTKFDFAHEVILARDLYVKIFSAKKWQEFRVIIWTLKLSRLLRKIRKNDDWSGLSNIGAIRLDNSLEQHGWIW